MSFIVYNIEFYNSRTNERINSATNKLNNSQSQQPIALSVYLWIEAFLFSPWVIMRQYLMVGITLFAHHCRANLAQTHAMSPSCASEDKAKR